MSVRIRPAANDKECALVGDIFYEACNKVKWHREVDSRVDPEELQNFVHGLACTIRKQYHGVVILAELEGKIVGYLLAWEHKPGSPDPYRHKSVNPRLRGRHMPIWWSLQGQIDKMCDQVDDEYGPFIYVDEVAVLPEYQKQGIGRKLVEYLIKTARPYNLPVALTAAPEALRFYERINFKRFGKPTVLVGDDEAQLVPMLLKVDTKEQEEGQ